MPKQRWNIGGGALGFCDERTIAAVHEAGHALACCAFGGRVKIASIRGDARTLGQVRMTAPSTWSDHTWLVVTMAGAIGESRYLNRPCDFRRYPSDQKKITAFVRKSPFDFWADDIKSPLYLKALGGAYAFVNAHWGSICATASYLLANTSATHDEIAQFV